MKPYAQISSSLIIAAAILFAGNRICESILVLAAATFGVVGSASTSFVVTFIYIFSVVCFVAGLVLAYFAIKQSKK